MFLIYMHSLVCAVITATHHCHPSLPPITAVLHCCPSLPSFTAVHHCCPSLPSITATLHCRLSLPPNTAVYHCHPCSMRLSRRRLRNTPRYHQRMRRRQNPYVQYSEGTTSPTISMLSDGSDVDDLPLRLSPSPQHELGGYVSLPLNNTQLDSLTRSLSPIALQDIRHLVDKEKSLPPSAGPLSAAGGGKRALQKRRRPIGQSDTTVYGDSSSSDSDSDNDSDTSYNSLLQT